MLTPRGIALIATSLGAWLSSRILGVPELAMAAAALLALTGLAIGFTALASARLSTQRHVHPHRLFHDAEGTVEVRVRNRGRLPTATLQIEDRAPAALCDQSRFVVSPLSAGSGVTLRYHLRGRHRGRFAVGPASVRLRDPFGLASRGQEVGGTDEVVVYPPVWRLPPGLPLGGHDTTGGEGRPRPMATGEELANVREYVRGDDLRKVHWRTTAHRGQLMVRQDESPQNPQAVIVLDRRAPAHRGHGADSSFEAAVSTAASVTYHLSERSYAVRLMDDASRRTPRPMPWELVLERLAVTETSRSLDLEGVWRQLSRGVAGEGLLVTVTAVPDATETRLMVRAGRGFATRVAVLVDADSFVGRLDHRDDVVATAAALRAAGWRVAVLGRGDRLDQRWREMAVQRPTRTATAATR